METYLEFFSFHSINNKFLEHKIKPMCANVQDFLTINIYLLLFYDFNDDCTISKLFLYVSRLIVEFGVNIPKILLLEKLIIF